MATLDLTAYEQQAQFITSTAPNVAFVAGIGSGKSHSLCTRGAMLAMGELPGVNVPTPNVGVITAPTFPMLRDATLRTFMEVAAPFIADYNKSDMIVRMINGSEVFFRSASDPDKLRGPNILWWGGDEAALYGARVWPIMIGRTRQFGLAGYRMLATTPRGRNWVWKTFAGRERDGERYQLINAPTWANPFLSDDFVRDLIENYDADMIRQELLGEFLANEGIIYSEFDPDFHIFTRLPDATPHVLAGVDFGFVNASVIVVGAIGPDGDVTVIHEDYRRHRTDEDLALAAEQIRDAFGVDTFYCDPSNPNGIQLMQRRGVRAVGADNDVMAGINATKTLMKRHANGRTRFRLHSDCVYLASELQQYEWLVTKDGLRDQPKKSNDHAADALRYLVMGARQGMSSSVGTEVSVYGG